MKEALEWYEEMHRKCDFRGKWVIREEAETDPKYGKEPWKRDVKELVELGVVNLDKPPGPTSHEVVAWIKRMFGLERAGHGGTLDPKVTGVLPVALAEATKVIHYVMLSGKEYVMVIQFHDAVKEEEVIENLKYLVGEIYQRPPLRSSVKRQLRTKKVYYIHVLEFWPERRMALVRVGSESGTYMRKLAHDLGLLVGTGAHMRELRRTRSGPFHEDWNLVRMQDLSEAKFLYDNYGDDSLLKKYIMPCEVATCHMPKIMIKDGAVDAVAHGANVSIRGVAALTDNMKKGDVVAVVSLKGELVAIAQALVSSQEALKMEKGWVAKTKRVIMKPGTYPDVWRKKKASQQEGG
ncbi:putative rRNA pseudouridine synthase [Ignicoccus hospitalis KIN4/I]|uniref:Probable tRNA pseudouridine synthase B n=2 Tax=Ignicoccus TaxID=54258 RepID=A8AB02_IGNH4|nr:RNA-guided pseudouridylation complex pseudouridine synthase subunit Cbf5 [Ignicoccus hospitalis]ABU82104.1 putative rRNA pseudouridine synthase [Ignicoccus hospitalis KIN4/I]